MIAFSDAIGGGNGAARRLAPAVRLLCGAWVFVCCAVVPLDSPTGIALFVVAWLAWLFGCAMPPRRLALSLGFAICLFTPLLLLAPVAYWNGSAATWTGALRAPLRVGVRGVAGVTIGVGALSLIPLSEFADAVAALPLPRAVTVYGDRASGRVADRRNATHGRCPRVRGVPQRDSPSDAW